jgi:hypothetical protein
MAMQYGGKPVATQRVGHRKGQHLVGLHRAKHIQTTKLDPTLKRIGSKLRETTADIVEAPLTARVADLLVQLSTAASDRPPPAKRSRHLTKMR